MKARKGDWVRIHSVLLSPGDRAPQVPDDTAAVPLSLWVKGYLDTIEAVPGEEVEVITITGRRSRGTLLEVNPSYKHDYGIFIPELLSLGRELREILAEGDE